MSNKFKGEVIEIGPENRFSDKFASKQVVLVDDKTIKYPKNVAFEFINASMEKVNGIGIGDEVEITFEPNSRKSKDGRWFTSCRAWEVNIVRSAPRAQNSAPYQMQAPIQAPTQSSNDDLPF
jgi:hypothetical protein